MWMVHIKWSARHFRGHLLTCTILWKLQEWVRSNFFSYDTPLKQPNVAFFSRDHFYSLISSLYLPLFLYHSIIHSLSFIYLFVFLSPFHSIILSLLFYHLSIHSFFSTFIYRPFFSVCLLAPIGIIFPLMLGCQNSWLKIIGFHFKLVLQLYD